MEHITHVQKQNNSSILCTYTCAAVSRYYVALYYMKYITHNIKTITAYFVATYDKQQQAVIYYCGKYYMQK